jgi:hypothetical protein
VSGDIVTSSAEYTRIKGAQNGGAHGTAPHVVGNGVLSLRCKLILLTHHSVRGELRALLGRPNPGGLRCEVTVNMKNGKKVTGKLPTTGSETWMGVTGVSDVGNFFIPREEVKSFEFEVK